MSRYQAIDLGFKKVYFRPDLSLWTEYDLKRITKGKAPLGIESSAKVPFGESSVSKQAVFSLCTSMYTPQKPFVFP